MAEGSCPADFVQVSEDGTHLVRNRNGGPEKFYFSGANCYFTMVRSAEYPSHLGAPLKADTRVLLGNHRLGLCIRPV